MNIKNLTIIKSILWLLSALFFCKGLYSQSYIADIRRISVEDGLSSRFVNTVYKDSRGFMWIGTKYGLNRYDGYSFKHYTAENSTLSINDIMNIFEDENRKLWIGNPELLRSIDILDLNTGRIQSFDQTFKGTAPIPEKDIVDLHCDAEKNIWISTVKNEVYCYRNKSFERVLSIAEQGALEVIHAGDQFLWLWIRLPTDERKLLKLNRQSGIIEMIKSLPAYSTLEFMGFGKDNTMWLIESREKKLLRFTPKEREPRTIDMASLQLPGTAYEPAEQYRYYVNPANDLIWWSKQKEASFSFFIFHPETGLIFNLEPEIKPQLTYGQLWINNICFDSENRAWVATQDGIFIISLKKNKFATMLSNSTENYSVRGITEDNRGRLYVNTYSGTMQLDTKEGITKSNRVTHSWAGAARDSQGKLWFSKTGLIAKYDPLSEQSQYYTYPSDAPYPAPWAQWAIIRDTTGRVWAGARNGLYFLEPRTGLYRKFTRHKAFPQLKESSINHLYETKEGIWMATSSGLYFMEPGKDITIRYAAGENPPRRIPYDYLLHCYRDKAGIFWLATKGGGLVRFDPDTGISRQFTTADGLSSNIIYAVYEDDYGKLWLPSNYGLMQFDKKSHRVNTWLKSDGIAHNEFNTASHYRTTDGRFCFGGLSGITTFHPKDFAEESAVQVPLQLTACQVLDGKTGALTDKTTAVANTGALTLSPSDKSFVIEFALLNYENTSKNSYAYTLEGLDKAWTPLRNNSLRINALPYGSYVLHIKGQGIKGEQSANELTIDLLVIKPFYLKSGFILSCIFVTGLLIYSMFRWRLKSLKKAKIRLQETVKSRTAEIRQQRDKIERQAVKLKALDSAKSRFFANISHELRTPLTLILGHLQTTLGEKYGKIGQRVKDNLEVSRRNGRRLLNMIEEILDLSKMEAGKLEYHNKPVTLYALVDRLCDTFRSYIKGKNIRFHRHIALSRNLLIMLDEEKFEKIVTNLLSNAAKFTPAGGVISVSAEEMPSGEDPENKESHIKITVRDTGRGIRPDDLPHIFDRFYQGGDKDTPMEGGTGIGLALSKELAELFGGSLRAESRLGEGSIFSFIFPKKEAAALPEAVVTEKTENSVSSGTTPEKQPKTLIPALNGQTPAILIVEDHPEMRNFIRQQIAENYRVLEARDGIEALEILEKQQPDLILSDVMMPRMDGFQLLENLKANPATADISVIMLTARADRQDRLHALTIGVDDYLTKPFDEEELKARIRHSLKNRTKRQQWSARLPAAEKEVVTADRQFLTRAETVVIKAVSNYEYSIIDMAEDLNLSQRQLFRKIKAATGLSPLKFIHEIRLQKARTLLEGKAKETVAEVMYAVGFQKSDHFARVYRKRFGKLPSSYFL